MAIVTNTFTTFDAKGIREELANTIANISPEETPFQSNVGSESVSNTIKSPDVSTFQTFIIFPISAMFLPK